MVKMFHSPLQRFHHHLAPRLSPSDSPISPSTKAIEVADDDMSLRSLLHILECKRRSSGLEFSSGISMAWLGRNSSVILPLPQPQGPVCSSGSSDRTWSENALSAAPPHLVRRSSLESLLLY